MEITYKELKEWVEEAKEVLELEDDDLVHIIEEQGNHRPGVQKEWVLRFSMIMAKLSPGRTYVTYNEAGRPGKYYRRFRLSSQKEIKE